jgi:hypothetical protein
MFLLQVSNVQKLVRHKVSKCCCIYILALVALVKESERANLSHKVGDASPSTKAATHNDYPEHNHPIEKEHQHPTGHEWW